MMFDINKKFREWSYYRQILGRRGEDLTQVLKQIVGVYSSHPSAPLSLWARSGSFSKQNFYRLDEDRRVFRVPAMRLSVFMLPAETAYLAFRATVPPASDPSWEKRYAHKSRFMTDQDYRKWKKDILQFAVKPLPAGEIKKELDIPDNIIKFILNRLAYEGLLFRVGAESLRSNIISYVSATAWGKNRFKEADVNEALVWLAGEYLRAYGPARIKDFQWWAGTTAGKAEIAVSKLHTTELDGDYLLFAGDLNDFEALRAPAKDRIDLLPQWDSYTMGYAPDGRERFITTDMQHHLYGSIGATGGNSFGAVLVNGLVHGSWTSRFKGSRMQVSLNMFEKSSPKMDNDILHQFEELAALLDAKNLQLVKE